MRSGLVSLFLSIALAAAAQQPSSDAPAQPPVLGRVTGHIYCSDTQRAARFATIQLLSDHEPAKSQEDMLAGLMKSDAKGGGGILGNALTKTLSTMMKGSNLSAMTAMDGSFSLEKVPPGTYYVIPQLTGYVSPIGQLTQKERMTASEATLKTVASAAQKIEVQPNGTTTLELELTRGASIGGRVRYDDGSPASGVTPVLLSLDANGKWIDLPAPSLLPTTTGDDGRFRFSGLPAGKYAVKAALPTTAASMGIGLSSLSMHMNTGDALIAYSGGVFRESDVKPVEVKVGAERTDLEIVFPVSGLHSISGSVVAMADGHAVNTGSVELEDAGTKIAVRTAMIGKDGSFHFNYVPDGSYRVDVTSAMDVQGASGDVDDPMMAMLLNGKQPKSMKAYGSANISLTLPGNSEGLRLQVPGAPDGKP
jgi:hypothetical protein